MNEYAALLREAQRRFGPDHETTLEIEYRFEVSRDRHRSAADSMVAWNNLRERVTRHLDVSAPIAAAVRARHLRQLRRCGDPAHLGLIVEVCRDEVLRRFEHPDPVWLSDARADLAWVLRDRAWYAQFVDTANGFDPDADLREASGLIEDEVNRRADADIPDGVSCAVAEIIRTEVLIARARLAPADEADRFARQALETAEGLVQGDYSGAALTFDQLPPPHVLLAESLAAVGREPDARRAARLAYALQADSRVFDPARPLFTLAQCQLRDKPTAALEAARAALAERRATFPEGSYYVTEACRLVRALGDGGAFP